MDGKEVESGGWANMGLQESFIKLGFHLVMFFFYLYSMIGKHPFLVYKLPS